jgi:uncharacterized protein (TIGR00251 family)
VRAAREGVTLAVWVTPGAARSEYVGVADGKLRIRLAAPAREGRANEELVRFVAGLLGVARRDVAVVSGSGGRRKLVGVAGVTVEQAGRALRL